MKLLVVSRRYPPDLYSGTETVISHLVEAARLEHQVKLVAGWVRDPALLPPDAVKVKLAGLPRPAAWLRMARAARRTAGSFRPDVVLANSIETPTSLAPTAAIVYDFNFGSSRRLATARLRRQFYKRQARKLARVVVISEATRKAAVDAGLAPQRLAVIHPGVDTTCFTPSSAGDPPDGDGNPAIFSYPSRIIPGKGQHLAIDAFRTFCRRGGEAVLHIAGSAPDAVYLESLRQRAEGLDVQFHTDVDSIVPYYQRAHVILFPTMMEEGFGYTAVEGLACGKPVIHFRCPAVEEAVAGHALAVAAGDSEAMAHAMQSLMTDPRRREALGEEGRRHVLDHYSWPAIWSRYEQLLMQMASAGRSG